jgi:hypothetical protein
MDACGSQIVAEPGGVLGQEPVPQPVYETPDQIFAMLGGKWEETHRAT